MAKRMIIVGVDGDVAKSPVVSRSPNRRQAALRFDPVPDRVEPCLALLASKPPVGDWVLEVNWDGYRLAVHIERGKARILTRGGHDWTSRFPTIANDALELGLAIEDGEAVVLDEKGLQISALSSARWGAAAESGQPPAPSSMPAICCTSMAGTCAL